MSYIQSARGSSQREIKVPARSRLYQIDLLQKERSNLEAKIRTQLLKLDVLLEDQRRDELLNEVDTLESLFAEYLKSHSKCHMLIVNAENPDEFDRYSTDSIDRKVSTIKKRVIEVMDQEIVEERGERTKTAYRPEEIAEQLRELPFDKASSIVSSKVPPNGHPTNPESHPNIPESHQINQTNQFRARRPEIKQDWLGCKLRRNFYSRDRRSSKRAKPSS